MGRHFQAFCGGVASGVCCLYQAKRSPTIRYSGLGLWSPGAQGEGPSGDVGSGRGDWGSLSLPQRIVHGSGYPRKAHPSAWGFAINAE